MFYKQLIFNGFVCFVGVKGFEPSTPCSQSRCANRTALHPVQIMRHRFCECKDKAFYWIFAGQTGVFWQ